MTDGTLTWKETRFLSVPLTPAEIQQRGEQLANLVKERNELDTTQSAEKKRMKEAMEGLDGQIASTAAIVNSRVETRSVQVEMRCNLTLGMVEEVRIDTGEVVTSRAATKEDKIRAQVEAQTEIPGTDGKA